MSELVSGECADCGHQSRPMSEKKWKEGSKVREPGEHLCASCSSHRVKMVRSIEDIPDRLDLIKSRRMVQA